MKQSLDFVLVYQDLRVGKNYVLCSYRRAYSYLLREFRACNGGRYGTLNDNDVIIHD
jgi:hypothetical protein